MASELSAKRLRELDADGRQDRLLKLREELMMEKSRGALGGQPQNYSKIRSLRRDKARLHTLISELDWGH